MKTAVVILNYNTCELLSRFLPLVIERTGGLAEIVVADNASTDNSVAFLKEHFPQVRLITHSVNVGYASGYNQCLKQVDADYYMLLNSDVEVTDGWLQPMIKLLDSEANIAAVQPKILSYRKKSFFEFAGAAGGFIDKYGYPFCRGRLFDTLEQDLNQYNHSSKIFWASGACMLIRKSVFDEMGGFDDEFFAHMEEIDLCWRIQNAGYGIYYQPQSVVYHIGGGTLSAGNPRKTYLNFRNNLLMLHKNLPEENFYTLFIFKLILDGIAAFKFLFSDGVPHFKAVLNSHLYFYRHIGQRRKVRAHTQKVIKSNVLHGVYNGSIVWAYFIKRIRSFANLEFK